MDEPPDGDVAEEDDDDRHADGSEHQEQGVVEVERSVVSAVVRLGVEVKPTPAEQGRHDVEACHQPDEEAIQHGADVLPGKDLSEQITMANVEIPEVSPGKQWKSI